MRATRWTIERELTGLSEVGSTEICEMTGFGVGEEEEVNATNERKLTAGLMDGKVGKRARTWND